MKEALSLAALSLALGIAFAPQAIAGDYTSIVNPGAGSGNERCVTGGADGGGKSTSGPGTTSVPQMGGNCASGGTYSGKQSVVQLFANSQGATLTRVPDAGDQTWTANPGAGVFGIGRSASNSFTLGYLPGASGGDASDYTQLLPAIGSSGSPIVYLPSAYITTLAGSQNPTSGTVDIQTGTVQGKGLYNADGTPDFLSMPSGVANGTTTFRFSIYDATHSGGAELWSSLPADNASLEGNHTNVDHMVTWQVNDAALTAAHETEYVASFENASFFGGGDGDYNDYTFVFLNVIPEAGVLPPAPEPSTWAMMLFGFAALGLAGSRGSRKAAAVAA